MVGWCSVCPRRWQSLHGQTQRLVFYFLSRFQVFIFSQLDLDDLNVENAYFRSFDAIVRRQLDPVWHKVGPQTKQLVSDLATLRRLLSYALQHSFLSFVHKISKVYAQL